MNTTTVFQPAPTGRPTPRSARGWAGVRHARVTRSAFSKALSIKARYVYMVLCYLLEYDRPTCDLSQSEIARVAELSEGTVSPAMNELAQAGRIRRVPLPGGGYELTLLTPPELRQADTAPAQRDQMSDPEPERPSSPPPPPEPPIMRDQASDPAIFYDHADLEKEQVGASSEEKPFRQDPLYQRLMQIPNMHEPTARRIAQRPAGTVADFNFDLDRATEMRGIDTPPWFVISYWLTGQRLPQRVAEPPPDRPQRDDRRRPAGPEQNAPPDMDLAERQRARADELLGPDALDPDKRLLLYCAFDLGLDGQAALDWMHAELARGVSGG